MCRRWPSSGRTRWGTSSRRWLLAAAQAAADAAKEGGFMGFGGEQVSAGEQQMLDQVRAALGVA
jgi:hypothetical protein